MGGGGGGGWVHGEGMHAVVMGMNIEMLHIPVWVTSIKFRAR